MSWELIMSNDSIDVRCDRANKSVMLEVGNGGFLEQYVAVHLDKQEIKQLIEALTKAQDIVMET